MRHTLIAVTMVLAALLFTFTLSKFFEYVASANGTSYSHEVYDSKRADAARVGRLPVMRARHHL